MRRTVAAWLRRWAEALDPQQPAGVEGRDFVTIKPLSLSEAKAIAEMEAMKQAMARKRRYSWVRRTYDDD